MNADEKDKPRPGRVWSTAPPGAGRPRQEVIVAGWPAPATAVATRVLHLRRLLISRRYVWGFALFAGAGFLFFAAGDRLALAFAAPAAVALVTFALAYTSARRLALRDLFAGFANARGFTYSERIELLEVTPLLGAGDRRHCAHYMEGPLADDMPNVDAGLAHYTYEKSDERADRRDRVVEVWTPYRFTICVVDLPRAIKTFPGVFLSQRRGIFGRISGDTWLDYGHLRSVEMESSEIASKYELFVRRTQNDQRLMELFQPSFQVWLAELPMPVCFEYSGGTLVAYMYKHASDATSLEILLQATASIARRIQREGEPLRAVPDAPAAAPPPPAPGFSPAG